MSSARTSSRPRAALVLAFVCLPATLAIVAPAHAADPVDGSTGPDHTTAHIAIGVGAGLTIASFLLAESGDRAYDRYVTGTDPAQLEADYAAAQRYDRLAAGALIVGQVTLFYGLWRRFLHDPPHGAARQVGPGSRPTWSLAPCLGPDGPALAFDLRF